MMLRFFRLFLIALALAFVTGCATGPNAHSSDPLEPLNRAVYKFNDAVDGAVLKPVATGYQAVIPSPVRQGVTNFFNNIGDLWSLLNQVLQFELVYAGQTAARLGINTFLGLGGVLDIASDAGIQPPKADLGQTLGKWGVPSGPFLMLPILGPSTVRDGVGAVSASYYDPVNSIKDVPTRTELSVLRLVNTRALLLGATDAMDSIALDRYSFIRDIYLKRRQNLIKPEKASNDDDIDYSVDESPKQSPDQAMPKVPIPINMPSFPSILK